MPNTTEEKQTLRSVLCNALHVIERSRQMLEGVITNKPYRSHILRNMDAIETQISASQTIIDTLNALVDAIEGDTVVEFKHKMHPIVEEMVTRSSAAGSQISVELVADEASVTGIAYKIDGFYKSGTAILVPKASGRLLAKTRYGNEDDIDDFRELVALNHQWWVRSKDRHDGWERPAEPWATWMVEFGMVKVNTRIVKEYL